jgi:hypothetical protein
MPFLQCEFSHVPIRGQPKSQQVRRSASNRKRCFEKILAPEAPGRRGRLAAGAERSQVAGQHIETCNIYISEQKLLVQRLNGNGDPAHLREAKRLLINLLELRDLYESIRQANDELTEHQLKATETGPNSLPKGY